MNQVSEELTNKRFKNNHASETIEEKIKLSQTEESKF